MNDEDIETYERYKLRADEEEVFTDVDVSNLLIVMEHMGAESAELKKQFFVCDQCGELRTAKWCGKCWFTECDKLHDENAKLKAQVEKLEYIKQLLAETEDAK